MRIRFPASIIIVAAVSFLLPVAAAAAAERAPVLQELNAKRAAHGIPAGITENPAWSAGCNAHVNYMKLNGVFGHDEDPTKPGYTPEGDSAGNSSVLTSGGWRNDPFESAPTHLAQLLGPKLSVTGFSDNGVCVHTWPGYQRPYPDDQTRIYSYPGNGTKDWRFYEYTSYSPLPSAKSIGLSRPAGPRIRLFTFGPSEESMRLASGTLTDPSGKVIETITADSSEHEKGNLPSGGVVIPVKPLAPETTYMLRSDWKTLAPAGTWTYDQKVADLKRIWTLFGYSEASQKRNLDAFSSETPERQDSRWSSAIYGCQNATMDRPPRLPSDTMCRISQSGPSDTRSFSTRKDTTEDDQGSDDSGSDYSSNTTRISLRSKPRGRSARLTLYVGSTWVGQRVKLRLTWRSGPGRKTVRKTQTVTLKKKTNLTLKAPWKSGRVTLNVKGATQAIGDTLARTVTHKRSWKIR